MTKHMKIQSSTTHHDLCYYFDVFIFYDSICKLNFVSQSWQSRLWVCKCRYKYVWWPRFKFPHISVLHLNIDQESSEISEEDNISTSEEDNISTSEESDIDTSERIPNKKKKTEKRLEPKVNIVINEVSHYLCCIQIQSSKTKSGDTMNLFQGVFTLTKNLL